MNTAIIGGSGLYEFPELKKTESLSVNTPFGEVSQITRGYYNELEVFFMPRHGANHRAPPHRINYQANIAALKILGVENILAFNAVGAMNRACAPATYVIPEQVNDYTWGRGHTFFDDFESTPQHIDFTQPFCPVLRARLFEACTASALPLHNGGVYSCTQGPRLETASEIVRLTRDGGDIVGMTLMPEAALAREKEMAYASLCLVVNWAAGICDEVISLDNVMALLSSSRPKIREVLLKTLSSG